MRPELSTRDSSGLSIVCELISAPFDKAFSMTDDLIEYSDLIVNQRKVKAAFTYDQVKASKVLAE